MSYSWRPPVEIGLAHSHELLRLMAYAAQGACAFACVDDILQSDSTAAAAAAATTTTTTINATTISTNTTTTSTTH